MCDYSEAIEDIRRSLSWIRRFLSESRKGLSPGRHAREEGRIARNEEVRAFTISQLDKHEAYDAIVLNLQQKFNFKTTKSSVSRFARRYYSNKAREAWLR